MTLVRLVAAGLVVVVLGGACGGAGGDGAGKVIPAADGKALADRADRVAADLAAGACEPALAEARSLQSDVAALPVEPAVRDQAVAGAARLVAAISCPPATITTVPAPVVDPGPAKEKHKDGHGHDH